MLNAFNTNQGELKAACASESKTSAIETMCLLVFVSVSASNTRGVTDKPNE